jgi:hypothetical protein
MNTSVPKYIGGENAETGDKFAELRRLAFCLSMSQKRRDDGTAWYMSKNVEELTNRYNRVQQLCSELNIKYTELDLSENIRSRFLAYMASPPSAAEQCSARFTVDRFGQNVEDRDAPRNQAVHG